jgi:medium-chain acyl-[acyl-carrier-protein] hydrolase
MRSLTRLSSPSAGPRLLCLPWAGTRGDLYQGWARDLGDVTEVWAAGLPGRHRRAGEALTTDPEAVIAEIAAEARSLLDRPLAVFGHSMGALLGFEVVRALEHSGGQVSGLVVSGCAAPALRAAAPETGPLTDAGLISRMRSWGAIPEALLGDPAFLALALPPLRADLDLCDRYRHQPGAVVRAPLLALAGTADNVAPLRAVEAWAEYSTDWRGVQVISGRHLFVLTARPFVLNALATFLLTTPAPPPHSPPSLGVPPP